VQDINVTKWIDKASPILMQKCAQGTHIDDGELVVRKAGDKPLDYLVIELEDIMITSISTGGSGGEDRLTENVSLNFAKFKIKYQEQDDKGAAKGGSVDFGFNIAENASA
jgi:type VI secretion system secreted protein Hcp